MDPKDACGGSPFDIKKVRALDPDGPPYTGPGPHPATLVRMHFAEDPYITRLPRAWDADLSNLPAQLLVCASLDETFRQRVVDNCRYERSDGTTTTAKVLSARYKYRVVEVKTGRPVVTFTVPGTRNSCPGIAQAGVSTAYDKIVADADLAAKLRPVVLGPAR